MRTNSRLTGTRFLELPVYLWVLAASVLALGCSPILHGGFRGDDAVSPVEYRGQQVVSGDSLVSILEDAVPRTLVDSGRLNPVGDAFGVTLAIAFQERATYKAALFLLTLACAVALMLFLKYFGVRTAVVVPIAVVTIAISLQLKATHDPAMGYYGVTQFSILVLLASLALYLAFLRGGGTAYLLLSSFLAACFVLTYEGNIPLILAYPCLLIGRDRQRTRGVSSVFIFLAIGFAAFIGAAYLRTFDHPALPAGYKPSLDLIALALTVGRQAVSGIPLVYVLSGAGGNLGGPTRAEIIGALLRGGLAGLLLVCGLLVAKARGGDSRNTPTATERGTSGLVTLGLVFAIGSGLLIAVATQWQQVIMLGTGHLGTLWASMGVTCIAVGTVAFIDERLGLATVQIWVASAAIAIIGAISAYSNLRTVAIEKPGIEQRQLLGESLAEGVADRVPAHTTIYVRNRDFNWWFENFFSVGKTQAAADYFALLKARRKLDIRKEDAPSGTCPTEASVRNFPIPDCAPVQSKAAWLSVRSYRRRGLVSMSITNDGEEPSASPARTITVFQAGQQNATIAGTASSTPAITGLRTDGQPWSPTVVKWRVEDLGKGKMLFNSELIAPGDAPIAASVTDLESKVDFTQTIPASQTVRLFGTRYLLP